MTPDELAAIRAALLIHDDDCCCLECAGPDSYGAIFDVMLRRPTKEQIDTLLAAVDQQAKVNELQQRQIARLMPCPDCRDKVKAGECERCKRQRAEATVQQQAATIRTLREALTKIRLGGITIHQAIAIADSALAAEEKP